MSRIKRNVNVDDIEITPEMQERAYLNILEDMQAEKKAVEDQRAAIFNVMEDVSAAKEEIDKERIKINAVVQNLNEGVVAFDANGNVILANPMITKLTGLPETGFSIVEFIRLFKGVDVEEKINSAFANRQKTHIEEITLIGRFFYEMFFTPIIDPHDNTIGSIIVLNDITHIKEIERMKTEFVAVASHQLRTPLTAIKLFIEMLSAEEVGKLNVQQKDYMDNVGQSTERMIRLVNDLLNVSRIETGRLRIEPKLVQIEDFIQDIINDTEPVAGDKKSRIVFEKPFDKAQGKPIKLPQIPIDPSLMRQVIHNLITNAVRYSPTKQSGILVKLAQENNNYVVSVKDSGIGIPKEVQSRIFEKFFRADNAQKAEAGGSGLGLYVAKMIVEASGGKLWFESPPKGEKKGTVFYVAIPVGGMKKKEGEKGLA